MKFFSIYRDLIEKEINSFFKYMNARNDERFDTIKSCIIFVQAAQKQKSETITYKGSVLFEREFYDNARKLSNLVQNGTIFSESNKLATIRKIISIIQNDNLKLTIHESLIGDYFSQYIIIKTNYLLKDIQGNLWITHNWGGWKVSKVTHSLHSNLFHYNPSSNGYFIKLTNRVMRNYNSNCDSDLYDEYFNEQSKMKLPNLLSKDGNIRFPTRKIDKFVPLPINPKIMKIDKSSFKVFVDTVFQF